MRSNMRGITTASNVVAFPSGPQAASRLRARMLAAQAAAAPAARPIMDDGAWYHEAAIAEDRATRDGGVRTDH